MNRLPAIAALLLAVTAARPLVADPSPATIPRGTAPGGVAQPQSSASGGLLARFFSSTRPPAPAMRPHPAVVRVIVPERGSTSYGSGTLVDVHGEYGLVLTNWHVVCDAAGPPTVVFPDGFRSSAQVVKVDRDWDLAALAIWKPSVIPVALAQRAPQPGERLSIAGYGGGPYRQVAGMCTQYVAPGMNLPMEMVELAASARQGDSGGPILNGQGELAGVLFGEGNGRTAGSYCGRVRRFLKSVLPDAKTAEVAANAKRAIEPGADAQRPPTDADSAYSTALAFPSTAALDERATVDAGSDEERFARPTPLRTLPGQSQTNGDESTTGEPGTHPEPLPFNFRRFAGQTRLEQLKTILAMLGAVFLVLHVRKVIGGRRDTSRGRE